jgi:hypothetical protein
MTKKQKIEEPEWIRKIEKEAKDEWREVAEREKPRSRTAEYISAIVANLVMFWVFGKLLSWGVPFLTSSFTAVLWVINISIAGTIACNLAMLIHDGHWFRGFVRLIQNALSFLVLMTFYIVFPFDFTAYHIDWSKIIHILLILGMISNGIAIIMEFFRMLFGPDYRRDRK